MKIEKEHMYHGAALNQIAEHPQFTAINSLKIKNKVSRSAYTVNGEIGIFLKHAGEPKGPFGEYSFNFQKKPLKELAQIQNVVSKLFLALVCVKDREICCLSYEELINLVNMRKKNKGATEEQYPILVTVEKGKSMRVYINAPGVRGKMLGKEIVAKRNAFPEKIFN